MSIRSPVPGAYHAELVPAPPLSLHGDLIDRTDANSPVHRWQGRTHCIFSHFKPLGHSYRRIGGDSGLDALGPAEGIRIAGDPNPATGKWIESVWRAPGGRLYGWYHAEERAPCDRALFAPHIGALVSDDDGLVWNPLGEVLRASPDQTDCTFQNGFFAGGFGDFCVLPDRSGEFFQIFFSSYLADESAQGVALARYPLAARDAPAASVEMLTSEGWRPAAGRRPAPVFPTTRGWRYPDPVGFWGPAVHFNPEIDAFVMLLNRTAHGAGDLRQEGIYISFNRDSGNPGGWSAPQCLLKGGGWYPQVIGQGEDESDTRAGSASRFFFCGYSAWKLVVREMPAEAPFPPPLKMTREWFAQLFGPRKSIIVA